MAMTGTLTEQGLSAVLALFDPDPARAAAHYEALRRRLIRFFVWKGVLAAEDCADETIDRVARRLAVGEEIRSSEPVGYFQGVARNVLREHWAREEREARHRTLWPREALTRSPEPPDATAECLQRCLDELAPATRRLVLQYYEGSGGGRIASRQAMARSLGLPVAALRVRMHRLRVRLEACVARRQAAARETFGPSCSPMDEDDEDGDGRG
jgi:DNA-directed RNA polymerase specialized sigma24 family protein